MEGFISLKLALSDKRVLIKLENIVAIKETKEHPVIYVTNNESFVVKEDYDTIVKLHEQAVEMSS